MLPSVEKALEYDKIREFLKQYTASQLGTARVEGLAPTSDVDKVRYLLTVCSEAKFFHELYGQIPLGGLTDIRKSLSHAAKVGAILEPEELLNVRKVAQIPTDIHKTFEKRDPEEFPNLFAIVDALPVFPELVDAIVYCLNPEGLILDRASPELRSIRRKRSRLRASVHQKLEATLRSPAHQKAIQEPVITSRNNRYVIPIKQEARSSFKGVVQGQSTSGATFFVEPLEIVQMNNELHEFGEAEHREIRRILLDLTDRVRDTLDTLEMALELLAELDFLNAKARFSLALDAVEPKVNTRGVVKLIEARHPVLEFHLRNAHASEEELPERVVPTNVHIGDTFNTLIITGPNTGGKTVVLKTVGLLTLMAQSGLHIPAVHGSEIGIFDMVFADIGDDQGIEQSLSTFSSHITKIAEMLKKIQHAEHALVLLDEIGAGTDPSEGTALGMALLDWLGNSGVNTIVTTHYGALKAHAHTQKHMENASMEFDWTTLRPTYRLQVGVPGSSNAIKIAERLGIPAEILEAAETHLGTNAIAVEDLLVRLQETQDALEADRHRLQRKIQETETAHRKHTQRLQTLETERSQLKREAEREARDIVADARRTVENLVTTIRKEQASKASIQTAFSKIETAKKSLQPKQPTQQRPKQPAFDLHGKVSVGDKVRVKKLSRFGEVTAIKQRGKMPLQILVGNMQMQVAYHEIDSVQPKQETSHLSTSVLDIQYSKANTISSELNIRGMLVKEALNITDKYLDDAYLAGMPTARILHGRGTGALKNAVHAELREHPHVTKYQFAPYNQGGEGVTIVTFKE